MKRFWCAHPIDGDVQAEQSSVAQLLGLLGRTIEAISFILLLNDHKLDELVARYIFPRCPPYSELTKTQM